MLTVSYGEPVDCRDVHPGDYVSTSAAVYHRHVVPPVPLTPLAFGPRKPTVHMRKRHERYPLVVHAFGNPYLGRTVQPHVACSLAYRLIRRCPACAISSR